MNEKLAQALHYLIWLSGERNWPLSAAKLANSIVMSEAFSLRFRHRRLTGTKIIKTPQGPIPGKYDEHIRWLELNGLIKISEEGQHGQTSYESLSRPDLSAFDDQDLNIMADICESCCKIHKDTDLSNPFRDDILEMLDMGEEIPLAACLPGKVIPSTPEQLEKSRQKLKDMGYEFITEATEERFVCR